MDDTMESRVRALVSDHLGVGPEELAPTVLLVDELAADSLDLVELSLDLETEFDIELPEHQLERVRTYGDLVELTLALTRRRRARAWTPERAPRIWAHVIPAAGESTLARTLPLTPYTAEEVSGDALHAGPGSKLEVTVASGASDADVAWVQDQFAWLRGRGVQVTVDRALPSAKQRHRPQAA